MADSLFPLAPDVVLVALRWEPHEGGWSARISVGRRDPSGEISWDHGGDYDGLVAAEALDVVTATLAGVMPGQ